jgi:CRISPR system Cascade subunit CasE
MYLSQLLVNTGDDPDKPRPGLAWIKQTYRVHQRIWMAFPDDARRNEDPFFLGEWSNTAKPQRRDGGFLFRIEPDRPTRILVQSVLRPDWEYAFQNAPHLLGEAPKVREFDPEFSFGQRFRFRLVMLMVKRRSKKHRQEDPNAPLEVPIQCLVNGKPDPECGAWRERLREAADVHGFEINDLRVQPSRIIRMKDKPISFNAALFDGVLTCTSADRLKTAVINGVGRGKAFGMGLLSLAALK